MRILLLAIFSIGLSVVSPRLVEPRLPLALRLKGDVPLMNPYIVGGEVAEEFEFPFIISMRDRIVNSHTCGGSIYNENWIISAGHCVYGYTAIELKIVAAEYNLRNESGHEQERLVEKIILHEAYNPNTIENDISLIKLREPLDFSDGTVGRISLPPQNEEYDEGTTTTVSGWGTLHSGDIFLPSRLHKVDVPVVSDTSCRASYGVDSIYDSMICAGFPEGGKDSCQGDSGGPLFIRNGVDPDKLVGIVSWGRGCAEANYPGVYTQVSYFRDWIEEKIANN